MNATSTLRAAPDASVAQASAIVAAAAAGATGAPAATRSRRTVEAKDPHRPGV